MQRGRLAVITGPMFAGKTAVLIARARKAQAMALRPAFDTRGGIGLISSRDHSTFPALSVSSWPAEAAGQAALVLDEAQFMMPPRYAGDVVADVLAAVRAGTDVAVSGLDTDYLRHPFEVIARFRAVADEEVMLRARCHVCGAPAAWTAKKSETGRLLEVGDTELYEARCDTHWSAPGSVPDNPRWRPSNAAVSASGAHGASRSAPLRTSTATPGASPARILGHTPPWR